MNQPPVATRVWCVQRANTKNCWLCFYTMDTSNTSTDPKEVELTEHEAAPAETKKASQSVDVKVTFCTHVGWDGVLVMLFMLVVAGLFAYVTYQYTSYFNNFQREFVWLFMLMGLLFVMVVVYYLLRWKHLATTFMEEERKRRNKKPKKLPPLFLDGRRLYTIVFRYMANTICGNCIQ